MSAASTTPTDGFVAPGQTLYYSATVKNELDNRQAEGLLSTEASPILDMSKVPPRSFNLRPQTQANMAGELKVLEKPSGAYSLTQVAGALIADLSVESDQASLWLRFDDPVGSTTYADSSGRVPAHDGACVGTGCTLDPAAGRVGGALKLAGTSYVSSDATMPAAPHSVSFWFKVDSDRTGGLFAPKAEQPAEDLSQWGEGLRRNPRKHSLQRPHVRRQSLAPCGIHGSRPGQARRSTSTASRLAWTGSPAAWSPAAGVILGGESGSYLVGAIDEVRLFERVLTPAEVTELADQPIFHMDFDQTDRWADVSSYHTRPGGLREHLPGPPGARGQRRGRELQRNPIPQRGHLIASQPDGGAVHPGGLDLPAHARGRQGYVRPGHPGPEQRRLQRLSDPPAGRQTDPFRPGHGLRLVGSLHQRQRPDGEPVEPRGAHPGQNGKRRHAAAVRERRTQGNQVGHRGSLHRVNRQLRHRPVQQHCEPARLQVHAGGARRCYQNREQQVRGTI